MKTDWQTKKLGEVCDVITDGVHNSPSYVETGIPMLDSKHIDDAFGIDDSNPEKFISKETDDLLSKRCKPKENDILISSRGSIGKIAIVREGQDFNIMGNIILLRLPKTLKTKFIVYSLHSELKNIEAIARGVAQKGLYLNQVRSFEIPLPPLPEQQRIVAMLDEAFAAIATAKENAEKNLQNARELFESYLQSVFANTGDGWEEKRLGEVIQKTETIDPTKNPNKEFIYLDVSSVNKENLTIENTSLIIGKDAPSRARKLIRTDDVIFATVRPTLRRIAIIPEEFNKQVCSTGYFVLRTKEPLNNKLVFYFLQTDGFNEKMEKLQKGASYPAVTDGEVMSQIIPYPKSLTEQKSIVSKLDALSLETKKLEAIYQQKLADLDELKKSVLQKAFNGGLA